MKKLTKLVVIALCACLALFAFAACGNATFDREGVIAAVTREEGSGSRSAFMESVFGSGYAQIQLPVDVTGQTSTPNVRAFVTSNAQSIGYDSFGQLTAGGTDGLRILSVDGIMPSLTTIQNGTYGIARPFIVAYRTGDNKSAAAREFHRFLSSTEAHAVMTSDAVALTPRGTPAAFSQTAGTTGTVNIVGSTSVLPAMNRLRERFLELTTGITVTVGGGGSGAGRTAISTGTADFGMVSSAMSATHVALINTGAPADYSVFADDAIAVIVHASNPLTNITTAQLQRIFNRESDPHYLRWSDFMPA